MAKMGRLAVVEQLLGTKADLKARTSRGYMALPLAWMDGWIGAVECLVERGAHPNHFFDDGLSLLARAALTERLKAISFW